MKKLVLFFIFAFFASGAAVAKSVEFSAISNTSLEADHSVKYADIMTPSIKTLLGTVEQINKSPSNFTLFIGDNIAGADKYSLVMFAKIIKKLEKPSYVIVGDKDVAQTKELDKKEYYRVLNIFSPNKIRKLPDVKKIDGFIFVFIDGVNQFIPSASGYYKEDQTAWLDMTLKKYKNDPVIIVGHYPVFASDELTEKKLPHRISDFHTVLSHHNNVIAIISGHHNIEDEYITNNIYNINLQSLSKTGEYKKICIDYNDQTKKAFIKTRIYKVE